MQAPSFEASRQSYLQLWQTMAVNPDRAAEINQTANRVFAYKTRYQAVSKVTQVPWMMIGCIHERESGLRFGCHLHNGDPLSARTVHVPVGRPIAGSPPFSWEVSAIDALQERSLDKIFEWRIERILYELEGYNGWGYQNYHHMQSPYLWSYTNHYTQGKYDSDGHFNPELHDPQVGCAPLYQRLLSLDQNES